ncbi:MAG: SDR family NAD(P)-dependent oxidoreductase [Deltaproteobacteria bacterium]|nr:SDR family NAD(P)-dependent oxidoreductase [Deltaproteobacteria bacterium]
MDKGMKVAVVTGGNRGLGYATCDALASQGFHVVLTSRDDVKGKAAAARLAATAASIDFVRVDVERDDDVTRLVEFVTKTLGRIDVLVNNAGIALDGNTALRDRPDALSVFAADFGVIRQTFETNTLGSLRVALAVIPSMRERNFGRIVNVSSGMGGLTEMNGGCPGYRLSKAALNAVTRILADELKGSNVLVNSVCPGWVRTDMGGESAPRLLAEGVAGIVWAATLPDGGPSGGFFRDGQPIAW